MQFDADGRQPTLVIRALTTRVYLGDALVHLTAGLLPGTEIDWIAHCVVSPLASEPDLGEINRRVVGTPIESEVILTMFNVAQGEDPLAGGIIFNAERRLGADAKTFRVEGRFAERLQIATPWECSEQLIAAARKGLRRARRLRRE